MNPFTLNGRKAGGGFGTISTKPTSGGTGSLLSTSKAGGASVPGSGLISGANTLQVPISTSGALSSINGDRTPQKKKISGSATMGVGAITSSSGGTKKADGAALGSSKLGTGTSGNVLGYSTGINQ